MTREKSSVTTKKKKIGKVTYSIESSTSEDKGVTLIQKINKCVIKDIVNGGK